MYIDIIINFVFHFNFNALSSPLVSSFPLKNRGFYFVAKFESISFLRSASNVLSAYNVFSLSSKMFKILGISVATLLILLAEIFLLPNIDFLPFPARD